MDHVTDDATEQVVLVDADDRPVGVAPKLAAHRQALRHRAFSVFVRDRSGRLLLQRRATGKYHSPGLWSNTCCGHPRPGEAVDAAAARRLGEEMGFTCPMRFLGKVSYAVRFPDGMAENEVVSLFVGTHDGPVAPNGAEVAGTAWTSLPDLLGDMGARPHRYTAWFRIYLADHLPLLSPALGQGDGDGGMGVGASEDSPMTGDLATPGRKIGV